MSRITTHVLDVARGKPAAGVAVTLAAKADGSWRELATSSTDEEGRAKYLLPEGPPPPAGTYRLRFETGPYFEGLGTTPFFPYVEVVFIVQPGQHYHVPLLLSPFGYSTYRGT